MTILQILQPCTMLQSVQWPWTFNRLVLYKAPTPAATRFRKTPPVNRGIPQQVTRSSRSGRLACRSWRGKWSSHPARLEEPTTASTVLDEARFSFLLGLGYPPQATHSDCHGNSTATSPSASYYLCSETCESTIRAEILESLTAR